MWVRTLRASLPVLIVGALGLPVACSSSAPVDSFDAGGPVVIGVLQSLTGNDQSTAGPLRNAARVAEWQFNAAGGLNGRPVQFRFEDDGSDQAKATLLAEGLINDKVVAVIGPTTSTIATNIAPKFFDSKTILISSTVITTSLTTAQPANDRYFFRTVPPADVQGRLLAAQALKGPLLGAEQKKACRRVALVVTDDATGNSYADAFKGAFTSGGGQVVREIKVKTTVAADYKADIATLVPATLAMPTYDCLGLLVFSPVGAQFMRDYKDALSRQTAPEWATTYVLAWHVVFTSAFLDSARTNPADPKSPTAAEGVVGIVVDPDPQTPEFSEFRKLYGALFPAEATGTLKRNTGNTYDAAVLLLLAMQRAGSTTDRARIRDALFEVSRRDGSVFTPAQIPEAIAALRRGEDIDYKGASGPVDFDDFGNVKEDFIVWQVKQGAYSTADKIKAENLP